MVDLMVEAMAAEGGRNENIKAYIVGGFEACNLGPACAENILHIRKSLQSNHIGVAEQDILGKGIFIRNIILDSETGQLSNHALDGRKVDFSPHPQQTDLPKRVPGFGDLSSTAPGFHLGLAGLPSSTTHTP